MARTPHQLAALCVAMAFAISGGGGLFLSQGLGQDELGPQLDGKKLFDKETFGGNGRTCLTCHSERTGTLTWPTFSGSSKRGPQQHVLDP